jgi:hypothetical protein
VAVDDLRVVGADEDPVHAGVEKSIIEWSGTLLFVPMFVN